MRKSRNKEENLIGKISFLRKGLDDEKYSIVIMNEDGLGIKTLSTTLSPIPGSLNLSKDGKKLVFISSNDKNADAYTNKNLDIFIMNSDGSGEKRLTFGNYNSLISALSENKNNIWNPQWVGNDKISFYKDGSIFIMNSDGSNQIKAFDKSKPNLNNTESYVSASYSISPDGSKIAFGKDGSIFIMNSSGEVNNIINKDGLSEFSPNSIRWSPDGSKLIYTKGSYLNAILYTINADGSSGEQITNSDNVKEAYFSPEGNKIVFILEKPDSIKLQIYTINLDGTNMSLIANFDSGYVNSLGWANPSLPSLISTPSPSPVTVNNSLILVQGGTFMMGAAGDGSSNEKQTHQVTLSSFYIGKYEVTQKEYQSVMGTNPSDIKANNLPVEQVSWFDAIKYCNAKSKSEGLAVAYNESTGDLLDASGTITTDVTKVKGYRLPTEAEWEFAAKGGNKSKGYKYSGSNSYNSVAVNSTSKPSPVGSLTPNELGIYDMSGNVWEWCTDWYSSYNSTTVTNPYISSKSSYRVIRGGGWNFDASGMASTERSNDYPNDSNHGGGFRIVRSEN